MSKNSLRFTSMLSTENGKIIMKEVCLTGTPVKLYAIQGHKYLELKGPVESKCRSRCLYSTLVMLLDILRIASTY